MNLFLPLTIFLVTARVFLSSKKRITNDITFESTATLKSASIVLIMVLHFGQHITRGSFMNWYMWAGGTLVGMFFFVSGYGDITHFERKRRMSAKKLVRKITMLLLITWMSTLTSTILSILSGEQYSFLRFLSFFVIPRNPSMNPLPDGMHWFLYVYIFLSVTAYLCTKYFRHYLVPLAIATCIYVYCCVLLGLPTFWYNSVFCFIVGALFAKYRENVFALCNTKYATILIITLITMYILLYLRQGKYPLSDVVPPIVFSLFLVVFLSRYTIYVPAFTWLNPITYDIYMWHTAFLYLLIPFSLWTISSFCAWVALSISSSYICHTVVTALLGHTPKG